MLREWGQIALDSEDKDTAAARWSEMAALVLPSPPKSKTGIGAMPIPTLAQFNQAADVAYLAGDNGLPELGLRIVRESLQAGPPVNVTAAGGGFGMARTAGPGVVRTTTVRSTARPAQT